MGMEPFVAADDNAFGHLIASIPNPVANLQQALAFKVGLAQRQAETAQAQEQVAAIGQKIQRSQDFQRDLAAVQGNPDANAISSLMMKYPEFTDQLKAGWDVKDNAVKTADLTQLGEIYSAAASGNWGLAAKQAQARVDADKAAGRADPGDDAFLQSIQSAAQGDAGQQKAVLTSLGTHIAAVSGPEHFATVYGALKGGYTLEAGATRYDENGNVVAQSPFIKGADNAIYERDGTPTGTTPTNATTVEHPADHPVNASPYAAAVAATLSNSGLPAPVVAGFMGNFHAEGGYTGAQGDGGSASGIGQWRGQRATNFQNVIGKPATEATPAEQAQFVSWEMQHPEAAGMTVAQRDAIMNAKTPAQAAALIDQYYERSSGRDRQIRMAAADAFAGGGSGPTSMAASSAAPPGYHLLVPGKAEDAPSGYRWTSNGQLQAIPGGPADKPGSQPPADAELTDAATQFLLTGQMPAMGMGGAGIKQAILAKRSELMRGLGISAAQLPAFQARYKADQASLDQSQKMLTALDASEGALRANAQQVLQTQKALVDEGIIDNGAPILNSLRMKTYKTIGSADTKANIKAYEDAVNAYATEYAKFMSSASGMSNTPSSDAARAQALELNNLAMGPAALASHMRQSLVEAQNKKNAVAATNQHLQQRLSSYIPSAAGTTPFNPQGAVGNASPLPQGAKIVGTYQGRRVVQLANGKRMVEQ